MPRDNEIYYTLIYHQLRLKYGLSNNDYCVLGYIYNVTKNGKYRPKIEGFGAKFGFSRSLSYKIVKDLKSKGLVCENEFGELCSTQMWADEIALIESKIRKS